jgi:hypothetical protein
MRRTNPIWPGRRVNLENKPNFDRRRKMSGGDAQPTKRRIVRNEPNFARPLARAGGEMRKTKPNLGQLGYVGKGRRVVHSAAGG